MTQTGLCSTTTSVHELDYELTNTFLDSIYSMIKAGDVALPLSRLISQLRAVRLATDDPTWEEVVAQCLDHPLRDLIHKDPFTSRAFDKPRGYPGDAVMIDYIYSLEPDMAAHRLPLLGNHSRLAADLLSFTTTSPACFAVRERRRITAAKIDQVSQEVSKPHIFAIAAGHLREAQLSKAFREREIGRFAALDQDRESLNEIHRSYDQVMKIEAVDESIRSIISGRLDLGTFDLVYALGLYDYLDQPAAQGLTSAMFKMLKPGGRILIGNFLPAIADVGYMESYMGWRLVYRTPMQILDLAARLPVDELAQAQVFIETYRNIGLLEIQKRR